MKEKDIVGPWAAISTLRTAKLMGVSANITTDWASRTKGYQQQFVVSLIFCDVMLNSDDGDGALLLCLG